MVLDKLDDGCVILPHGFYVGHSVVIVLKKQAAQMTLEVKLKQ